MARACCGRCGLVRLELLISSTQSWIMNRAPIHSTERTRASHTWRARSFCLTTCWASRMKLAAIPLALVLAATACKHPGQARHQPPTAAEIQQKIVGTWFLDRTSAEGNPETITVVFGADGSFESSRNFTDLFEPPQAGTGSLAYRATWHATDGYFTVTKSNSLPNCNLQMFTVERLDEHEMVCGHPSAAGERFRR